jgi:hypothetical protein
MILYPQIISSLQICSLKPELTLVFKHSEV